MAIESYFKNIADAIREKAGTSGLITPAQMPQAIADIPSGGSGNVLIDPYLSSNNITVYSDGDIGYSATGNDRIYLFNVTPNKHYLAFLSDIYSNRFRVCLTNRDPATITPTSGYIHSNMIYNPSTITAYTGIYFNPTINDQIYLALYTSNENINAVAYLICIEDLLSGE